MFHNFLSTDEYSPTWLTPRYPLETKGINTPLHPDTIVTNTENRPVPHPWKTLPRISVQQPYDSDSIYETISEFVVQFPITDLSSYPQKCTAILSTNSRSSIDSKETNNNKGSSRPPPSRNVGESGPVVNPTLARRKCDWSLAFEEKRREEKRERGLDKDVQSQKRQKIINTSSAWPLFLEWKRQFWHPRDRWM